MWRGEREAAGPGARSAAARAVSCRWHTVPTLQSLGGGERGSAEGSGHPSTCCLPRAGRSEIHRQFHPEGRGERLLSLRPPAAAGLARPAGCGSAAAGAMSGQRGAGERPGGPRPGRAPRHVCLCNVNRGGTNCLLTVGKKRRFPSFFFSFPVFIPAWPPATLGAASPPSSFPFISIS